MKKLCGHGVKYFFAALVAATLPQAGACQVVQQGALSGVSVRFASSFHHFFRAEDYALVNGSWSQGVIGVSYKNYSRFGHGEIGVAFGYKGTDRSLPLVMQDYDGQNGLNQNVASTFWQVELKAGPRVWWHVYPKFGFVAGYRPKFQNIWEDNPPRGETRHPINSFYVGLPIGFTVDLPTAFGTTGVGAFYEIGLSNTMRGMGWSAGSRQNGFTIEIHATIRTN